MPVMMKCPLCDYEGPQSMFESVDGTTLKCKRCRGQFEDPEIYLAGLSYADCDSRQAVFRFPFSLSGTGAEIRVRAGYTALLVGNNGRKQWLKPGNHRITDMPEGFQLYYVCMKPTVMWGSQNDGGFGAYGTARLSLAPDYPERYASSHEHILTMGNHLKSLMDWAATKHIQQETARNNLSSLELRDGYLHLLGSLDEGVTVTGIYPMGFRNAGGGAGTFSSFMTETIREPRETTAPAFRPPAEPLRISQDEYVVRAGTEIVVIRGAKTERHKADETITADRLQGNTRIYIYRSKTFEFPFGWGLANQVCPACGFFSAQGTVSFHIDSTEKMSLLLERTEGWQGFEEQLFFNVIRQEVAMAISGILNEYIGMKGTNPAEIQNMLSEMSIRLTDQLNGEGGTGERPVFRQYGLRVKQADILGISLYPVRR